MMKLKQQILIPLLFASLTGFMRAQAHDPNQALDCFLIDSERSQIGFIANHLEFLNVRGAFTEYDVTLRMAGTDWRTLELRATIHTPSIYTGRGILDDNLRSVDYFEVDTYPEITFLSNGVVPHEAGYLLSGYLTMKNVTKEVILPLTILDAETDQRGHRRIRLQLGSELNRHTFGVGHRGMPDRLINDMVRLDVQLEAIRQ